MTERSTEQIKCQWFDLNDDGQTTEPPCPNEATHAGNCELSLPVCAAHACRHSKTLARDAAEKAPTPPSWMAL